MKVADSVLLSQYLDLKNKSWQKASCGVTSLLMLMRHLGPKRSLPDLNKLYQVGLNRRAYIKNIGWRHSGLVGLAKLYGFKNARAYDLTKEENTKALAALKKELKKGPVMASVFSKYEPGRGGHLVVLLNLSTTQAEILDPDTNDRSKIHFLMPASKFIQAWKKRFIVVKS